MRELGLPQGPSLAVNQVCGGMGFFFLVLISERLRSVRVAGGFMEGERRLAWGGQVGLAEANGREEKGK